LKIENIKKVDIYKVRDISFRKRRLFRKRRAISEPNPNKQMKLNLKKLEVLCV